LEGRQLAIRAVHSPTVVPQSHAIARATQLHTAVRSTGRGSGRRFLVRDHARRAARQARATECSPQPSGLRANKLTPLNALVYELKGPYLGSHSSFWNLLPPGMRESAKALDMLETLASERRELTLTEMGRAAGFAKPTAHRLAQVLVARLSRARRSQRSPPTRAQGVGARLPGSRAPPAGRSPTVSK
jgi:IclR helix-turn-helix domain